MKWKGQFKIEFFQCLSGDVNANFALPVRYARYTLLQDENMARIFDFHAGGAGSIFGIWGYSFTHLDKTLTLKLYRIYQWVFNTDIKCKNFCEKICSL